MRMVFLIMTLAALVLGGFQADKNQETSAVFKNQADEVLIRRILAGEIAAIEEAGKSGNRLFVTYLRRELEDRTNDGDPAQRARIALAQFGETDQLQEVWCRAITDDPKRGLENPTHELEKVGGWFGIQGLQKLLTPDGLVHWHKPSGKETYSDVTLDALTLRALN